jgi:hypothetical protein
MVEMEMCRGPLQACLSAPVVAASTGSDHLRDDPFSTMLRLRTVLAAVPL